MAGNDAANGATRNGGRGPRTAPGWQRTFLMVLVTVALPLFVYLVLFLTRQSTYFQDRSIRLLSITARAIAQAVQSKAPIVAIDQPPTTESPDKPTCDTSSQSDT